MSEDLRHWLSAIRGKRIVVWGDLVADHTIYGDTSRISREAPVLILEKEWEGVTAGGAGNAVMNVAALGGVPLPVAVVGRDDMGRRLLGLLKRRGVDTSFVISEKGVETAVKTRVLAGGLHTVKQQVIRIDAEGGYQKVNQKELANRLRAALKGADGLIVSDYGLGSARSAIFAALGGQRSTLSVIDSRYSLSGFAGAVSATPNEPELEEVTGIRFGDDEPALDRAARSLMRRMQLRALLVTRGKQGMALFEPRRRRRDIPVWRPREIVDVTGAGDTVIAAYTLALAAGAPFADAARLANVAAGLAVMTRGAAAPSGELVEAALREGESRERDV